MGTQGSSGVTTTKAHTSVSPPPSKKRRTTDRTEPFDFFDLEPLEDSSSDAGSALSSSSSSSSSDDFCCFLDDLSFLDEDTTGSAEPDAFGDIDLEESSLFWG